MHLSKNHAFFLVVVLVPLFFIAFNLNYLFMESTWYDEALYAWYSKNLFADPSYLFSNQLWERHPPLFSILASPLNLLFEPITTVRIVSLVSYFLSVLLVFLIGRRASNELVGGISALFFSSSIVFFFSFRAFPDIAFTFFILLFIYSFMLFEENRNYLFLILPPLLVLLTKRSGLIILFFLGFLFLFLLLKEKKLTYKKAALVSVFFVFLISSVFVFFTSNFLLAREFALSETPLSSFVSFMRLLFLMASPFLLPFILCGVLHYFKNFKKMGFFVLVPFIILFFSFFNSIVISRFLLPILPFIFIFSAKGLELFKNRVFFGRQFLALFVVLLSIFLLMAPFEFMFFYSGSFLGLQEAGAFLKEEVDCSGSVVFDDGRRELRLYSDLEFEEFGGCLSKFPETKEGFEEELGAFSNAYVVVNAFSKYLLPEYISKDYLGSLGFKQAKTIKRKIDNSTVEVILVYKKTK